MGSDTAKMWNDMVNAEGLTFSIYKTKFSKMKTKLRVEQAKILLQESVHTNITIDGISQLAGFNSRSSFYSAFKNEMDITPSDYLRMVIEKEALKNNE